MPKVSVIIPTYNREDYLPDAIDSVLNQTYQDFEIIIIDDGSTDSTKNIVTNYISQNGERVKYLFQNKKGSSAARNNGIKNAKGEFIAFLDSDDIWLPEKLEKQIKLIESDKIGFVHSNAIVESNGKITSRIKPNSPVLNFDDLFLGGKNIVMSTSLIKKEFIEDVGMLDEALKVAVDYDLWIRILMRYPIKHINETLAVYREHNNNISSDLELMHKHGIKICLKLLKMNEVPIKFVKRKLAYKFYMLGKLYYERKNYRESLGQIVNSLVTDPLVGITFISHSENIFIKSLKIIKPYLFFTYLLSFCVIKKG